MGKVDKGLDSFFLTQVQTVISSWTPSWFWFTLTLVTYNFSWDGEIFKFSVQNKIKCSTLQIDHITVSYFIHTMKLQQTPLFRDLTTYFLLLRAPPWHNLLPLNLSKRRQRSHRGVISGGSLRDTTLIPGQRNKQRRQWGKQ